MNKIEFVLALQEKLKGLPKDDLRRSLEYYNEMIDDRMEDGLTEEEAVAAIGSIDDIVKQIIDGTPMVKLVSEKLRPKKKLESWQIICLILGAPIWLSLLLGLFSGLFSVYTGLWVVVITLVAVGVALTAAGIGVLLGSLLFFFTGHPISALFIIGCGLIMLGISIFLYHGGIYAAKGTIWLSKKVWLWLKSLFVGKEAKQ